MEPLVTSPPRRELTGDAIRVTCEVSGRSPLWFSVEERFAELVSDRADYVLVGLLMPAMKEARDLHIGGTVTDSLLHQANADLQRLLRMEYRSLHPIRVTADAEAKPGARPAGVATGFSGGVDSLATLAEYLWSEDVPESLRVTHLLNNNVGAHGSDGHALWQVRRRPLERAAADFGVPFVAVGSNLDVHYPRIGFMESVTMRNAAVPHLLGAGIGHLHVASALSFPDVGIDSTQSIANIDPLLVPLLSTAAVTVSSAGSGLTRVEKTLALIGRPEARTLDVCVDGNPARERNCSRCSKCMRTMLTFEIAGHLHGFCPDTFSLGPYAANRDAFIAKVLSSDDPYHREIRALASEIGWRWSAGDRWRGAAQAARARVARLIRRVVSSPVLRPLRQALRALAPR